MRVRVRLHKSHGQPGQTTGWDQSMDPGEGGGGRRSAEGGETRGFGGCACDVSQGTVLQADGGCAVVCMCVGPYAEGVCHHHHHPHHHQRHQQVLSTTHNPPVQRCLRLLRRARGSTGVPPASPSAASPCQPAQPAGGGSWGGVSEGWKGRDGHSLDNGLLLCLEGGGRLFRPTPGTAPPPPHTSTHPWEWETSRLHSTQPMCEGS